MKNLFFVLIAAAACMLTGCIVVEENYTFKKNGSGSMVYVMDMHEMMEQMGSLMDMSGGEGGGENPFAGAAKGFKEQSEKLKTLTGVSKVKFEEDKKGIYKIAFNFKNIKALNDALNKIMGSEDPTAYHTFFIQEGKVIKRIHSTQANLGDITAMLGEEGDSEYAQTMYESMKYKLNFKFASDVEAVYTGIESEEGAIADGKTLKMNTTFSEIMGKGPAALTLTAVLK